MENNRPRGRERNVTGPGKTVQKRGGGLGTGPVGNASGYQERGQRPSSGTRSAGTRSGGGMKLIILLLVLLLGGGGGLSALFGGQPESQTPQPGQQQVQSGTGSSSTGNTNWAQLLSGLGGGSISSGWQ